MSGQLGQHGFIRHCLFQMAPECWKKLGQLHITYCFTLTNNGPFFSYKVDLYPQDSKIYMEPPNPSESSLSARNLSERQIRVLEALYEHAYETKDIEYPWYLLWNECFTQLNTLFSDKSIYLTVGPQQQFTKRKHRQIVLDSSAFPL